MATRRAANRLRRTVRVQAPAATPAPQVDPLQVIKDKFSRLTELQARIEAAKDLYKERDTLLEELSMCFIRRTDTGWDVKSQITLGNKTYRLHPAFFDASKNKVVAKTFKAAFHSTMVIEG